jgi:hypothetical protein
MSDPVAELSAQIEAALEEGRRLRAREQQALPPDRLALAEREQRLERLEQGLSALAAKVDRVLANTAPPPAPERRSQMSPKRKSDLISTMGRAAYERLPW